MRALSLFLLVVFQGVLVNKVMGIDIKVTKNSDWQYNGRCVEFILKINLTATTPLSIKALAPFNDSKLQMRILGSTFTKDSGCTAYTGSYKPVLSSKTGDSNRMDDLKIDLGKVAVVGSCNIEVNVKFQMLKALNFVHGRVLWPGIVVKHQNGDVFATQQAVKGMAPRTKEPVLALDAKFVDNVLDFSQPVVVNVRAVHDCTRTAGSAKSTKITIFPPELFQYSSYKMKSGSIQVTTKSIKGAKGTELVFETQALELAGFIDFDITFSTVSSHVKQGRELEFVTFYVDAIAMPSSTDCPTAEVPYTSTKTISALMYIPFSKCDRLPGGGSDDIAYQSFTAYSYAVGAEPDKARFSGPGSWKSSKNKASNEKQFLQVNFTSMVKLRRFAVKGQCDEVGNDTDRFVKSLKVYYSDNGGTWNSVKEGSKVKVFDANTDCKGVAMIPFPYDIEAKYILIKPVEFQNDIAMKVQFYGCKSTTSEFSGPLATFPSRSIIQISKDIVICNTGFDRELTESRCYSSSDGDSWKDVHSDVEHVAFSNPNTGNVFAVGGRKGNLAFRTTTSKMGSKWMIISKDEFIAEKSKAGINVALSGDVPVTDNSADTPSSSNKLPATSGVTWGFTGKGVYKSKDAGVTWEYRAAW